MPAPSQLKKRTLVVHRLVEEEKSYLEELATEEAKIKAREEDKTNTDENSEFEIKQLKLSHEQTKAVLAELPDKIAQAAEVLENQINIDEEGGDEEELKKAKEVLESAKKAASK